MELRRKGDCEVTNLDELENWKYMLEQAKEYGLFFDNAVVEKMIQIIEDQQREIEGLTKEMNI